MKSIDRHAVSKALSAVATASVAQTLRESGAIGKRRAPLIGITGAPGAGKSTLIGRLGTHRLERVASLGVIVIDPSSPRSRGSLLGDRIRMEALGQDPRVFIRSLPSRSSQDGLTDNLAEIIAVLDAFGFSEMLIETTGVGQTAYGVRALADVEVLVLTPGAGDYVQAMKAGIMETADLYVINKADLPGADRLALEIRGVLQPMPDGAIPPIIPVRAGDEAGIIELSDALDRHLSRPVSAESAVNLERRRCRHRLQAIIERQLLETLESFPPETWDHAPNEIHSQVLYRLCTRASESEDLS